MSTAAHATARRTFYLRRSVHVAIAGAENALCGVRLVGAIDTKFDASCADCLAHTFEQQPELWAKVEPIADEGQIITGLPESTAGFDDEQIDTLLDEVEARSDADAAEDAAQRELDAPEVEKRADAAAMTAQSRESAARNTDSPLNKRTRYYNASARVIAANEELAEQRALVESLRAQLVQAEETLGDLAGAALTARDEFERAEDAFIG